MSLPSNLYMPDEGTPPHPRLILKLREHLHLTQTEAAAIIYKTWRAWAYWEAGDRAMDPALWELFVLKTCNRKTLRGLFGR